MIAVAQRVARARVTVADGVVADIGRGLLVFVGVERGDTVDDAAYVARKVANLRVFGDERGRMHHAVGDVGGSVLVVSQFTLVGSVRRGNRPDFTAAEEPGAAAALVDAVAAAIERHGVPVEKGVFGAHMAVELTNDGPVTILIDTRFGR